MREIDGFSTDEILSIPGHVFGHVFGHVVTDILEVRDNLTRAIEDLKPETREVILLVALEGFSYREVAAITDVPLGTVKTYIHRARNELKEALVHLTER